MPSVCDEKVQRTRTDNQCVDDELDDIIAYAFPPVPLIHTVLSKLAASRNAQLLLVAPNWPAQGWFSPVAIATSGRTEELAPRGRLINATGRLYADNPGAVSLMRVEAIKQITMANAFSAEIATLSTQKIIS